MRYRKTFYFNYLFNVYFYAIFSLYCKPEERMTFEQTIRVPNDHRLAIDLPLELLAGTTARVEVKVYPFVKDEEKPAEAKARTDKLPKLRLTKKELDEMLANAQTPISDSLTGILAHLGAITVEQIREERLAKYLP
jgi:hypothetical protein